MNGDTSERNEGISTIVVESVPLNDMHGDEGKVCVIFDYRFLACNVFQIKK